MLTITKFPQSALLIRSGDHSLAVDVGSYVGADLVAEFGRPHAVLVSHIHGDHFSEANLVAMGTPVHTVGEVALAATEPSLEIHVHGVGEVVEVEGTPFLVTFLESDHGPNVTKPVEQAAFLISDGDSTAYFMADMFNGAPRPTGKIDVMLVPVGDRGYTFSPEMALEHLRQMGWTGLTVPIHYDVNPPAGPEFVRLAAPHMQTRFLEVGETLRL